MQLLFLLLVTSANIIFNKNDVHTDEFYNIHDKGEQDLDLHGKNNFILLLGFPGSGKSTLAHFLSRDPESLVEVKQQGLVDTARKFEFEIYLPKVTVNDDFDQAVVEISIFEEHRNEYLKTAAIYFTKRVFNASRNLKFVMTARRSLFNIEKRDQFDFLLRRIVELAVDVNRYANGFCLVVTEVPVSEFNDLQEISSIQRLLAGNVQEFKQRMQQTTDLDEQEMLAKFIKLVYVLLDDKVNRIVVFRKPNQSGLTSQSDYSLENIANVRHMVFDIVPYVESGYMYDFSISSMPNTFDRRLPNNFDTRVAGPPLPPSIQTVYDIIEYKIYLMTHYFDKPQNEYLKSFIVNEGILKFYHISAFITEIMTIESRKNDLILSMFETYVTYTIPVLQKWPVNTDDKIVMVFLVSTLSSIFWNQRTQDDIVFVTNLHEYVDTTLESINQIENLGIIVATQNIKEAYSKSIDQNILEAQNYVTRFVTKEFDDIFKNFRYTTEDLVVEVEQLMAQIETHLTELRAKEKQLKQNMIAHVVFGVLNVAAASLSLMGPVGSAAGLALGAASGIAEQLVISNVPVDPKNPLSLPNGIAALIQELRALRQSRQEGHMEVIVITSDQLLALPELTQNDKTKVNQIKTQALTLKTITDAQQINNIIKTSIQGLQTVTKSVKPGQNVELQKKLNNTMTILNFAEGATKIAAPILDAMKKYKGDQDKLQIVLNLIKQDEQALKDLAEYQDGIFEVIVPMLDTFGTDMAKLEKELRDKTAVSLIVERWEISRQISKLGSTIQRFTEGFQVEKEYIKYFNQLNDAAMVVVTLFEKIQYYQEHKEFANYIADLNQVGGGNIPENSKYKAELASLKKYMVTNTVKTQCSTIISSFIQQVFPYAKNHLGSLSHLNGRYCDGDQYTITNTVTTVKSELIKMRDSILSAHDAYVHFGYFDSNFVSSRSFAVWDSDTYGNVINNLMRGSEVVLFSSVSGTRNAVKFNKILVRFTRTDGGDQKQLEQDLKPFTMWQTHFGNSIYQCDNTKFIIRSQPLIFSYALENDKNGNPIHSNNVYRKILNGDITLSPNAAWRLQLKLSDVRRSFATLQKYTHNNVKLEMYGMGQWVSSNVPVCRTRLEEFYDFHKPWVRT